MTIKLFTPKAKADYILRNVTVWNQHPYDALYRISQCDAATVDHETFLMIFEALMTEDRINPDAVVTLNCLRALDNLREGN